MQRIFLFCNCIVISTCLFGQGALDGYMKGANNTDLALTYSFENYNKYFFGSTSEEISLTSQSINLFVAHGFSDSLDLVAAIPFIWTDSLNHNFQDGTFLVRYRNKRKEFRKGALSLMTGAGLSLPLSNYRTDTEFPIGVRSTTLHARVIAQLDIYKGYFIMLKSGYDFRLTPIQQSAVPIMIKGGIAKPKFYADIWMESFNTFNAEPDERIGAGQGSSWLRIGGTIYIPTSPHFGVFVGGAQFLSGKNIGIATRVNVGFVYKANWKRSVN